MQIKPLLEINLLQYNSNYKQFLNSCKDHLDGFTIINKSPFDQPIDIIEDLFKEFSCKRIIPHLSLKQNYQGSAKATFEFLEERFLEYQQINLNELFIVSGMPRRSLDSLNFLDQIKPYPKLDLAIAYNPFLPSFESKSLENKRLENKLKNPFVKTVFIQLGEDLKILRQAIDHIKSTNPEIKIVFAVLNPYATRIISSFKLRPWCGVYYSQQYLSDNDYRISFTKDLLQAMEQQGVQVLLEFYSKLEDVNSTLELIN